MEALDVAGGKMYWTDVGTSKIQRANLDGSGLEDLVTTGVKLPVRIALDLARGKIYWTESSPADFMISRANLDGTGGEFLITGLTSPSGIALALQPAAIPAVSIWGVIVMVLLVLATGTIAFRQDTFRFPPLSPVLQALVLAGGVENQVRNTLGLS